MYTLTHGRVRPPSSTFAKCSVFRVAFFVLLRVTLGLRATISVLLPKSLRFLKISKYHIGPYLLHRCSIGRKVVKRTKVVANEAMDIQSMTFKSWEEGHEAYKSFARSRGFGVRLSNVKKDSRDNIYSRSFVCSCAGFKAKKNNDCHKKAEKNKTLTGCSAIMTIRLRAVARVEWFVFVFKDTHNQTLVDYEQS
ncbi:protein FAR1-RELATED SEQUENCE 5-like [Senna tora]|uniref:Protein FAR1-RELATED SEQUENCE 5-like n=1 Tax=Senna tora TaxID=362788 RepID=A0A834W4J9_9FABA|nr:protein FAR1-RELATED SEQUENCE 5-like [Senna tora]